MRFLFETSRIDAYSRLYFILAQGQKTTILHESFKERIDFLTATCRADSEKNEREKLILFINKWFLSLECALQNCQTFLTFGELKSKIECLTVRCFSKKNFRTFTNIFAKVTTFSTKTSYLIQGLVYFFDFVISKKNRNHESHSLIRPRENLSRSPRKSIGQFFAAFFVVTT